MDGYGDYVFVTSVVLVFVGLSDMGTTTIGVRESSAKKEKTSTFFSNILGIRFLLSLFLWGCFNILNLILPQFIGLRQAAFLASSVIIFLVLKTTSEAILQTFLRLDLVSLLDAIYALVFLLLLSPFVFFFKLTSVSWLMIFWSLASLFTGIIGLIIASKYFSFKISLSKKEMIEIAKESFPLGMYLLVYSVYDRGIDSFVLKSFVGSEAVGFYGLAYKIHGNLILGAAFLMNSLFPLISEARQKLVVVKKTFEKSFTVLFLTGLSILLFGFLLSPLIIKIIAGETFYSSAIALKILLGATLFSYLNHLTGYFLVALGEQKSLLRISFAGLIFNLFLNLIFIPKFSFLAAAVITVFTEIVIFILTYNFLRKKFFLSYSFKILVENIKMIFKNKLEYFNKL